MILNLLNNLKLFNFNTYSNLNKQFIHSSSLNYRSKSECGLTRTCMRYMLNLYLYRISFIRKVT